MNAPLSTDDLIHVDPEGDRWRVRVPGWGSFTVSDRSATVHIVDAAKFCFQEGRESAFVDVCKLIGAQRPLRRDHDV